MSSARKQLAISVSAGGIPGLVKDLDIYNVNLKLPINGVKCRLITEITKANAKHCRNLMRIFEVRHVTGTKLNFLIIDGKRYLSNKLATNRQSIQSVISSSEKRLVREYQHLFDVLWQHAIPADELTRAIEEGKEPEITELLYGPENTIRVSMECFATVRRVHDSCGDRLLPSVIISTDVVRNAYISMMERGVSTRFITEITRENLQYCKELQSIVGELRHLEGTKGNFGVSDEDYIASARIEEGLPMPRAFHSTAKLVIEQQQYFFETLWEKSMPAQARFQEIESGVIPERTEIVSGEENIVKFTMEQEVNIKQTCDNLIDASTAVSFVRVTPMFDFMRRISQRGVRSRLITEVTRDNLNECKALSEISELRHLPEVHGNFGITDGVEYRAAPQVVAGHAPRDLIRSTAGTFVKQQQYFFDTLWEKSMPMSQRVAEIEEGKEAEKIELIHDTQKSVSRAFDVIHGTKKELLVLFATPQTFTLAMTMDTPQIYKKISEKGVSVKILVPRGRETDELFLKVKSIAPLINLKSSHEDLNTRMTIMISDRKELMSWELRDENSTDPYSAGGIATYTNFASLAGSYAIIFDNLWGSTELAEHLRVANVKLESNEKAMKEFIDIAAHEIRTPIQPILGLAEVLKHSVTDPDQTKLLDAIVRNANRLHRLQEDILDVARFESRPIVLSKEDFNIVPMISELVKDFQNQISDGNVNIQLMDNSDSTLINADKGRLVQVVSNLLSNAVKFTRIGTIRIGIRRNNGDLAVSVIDTGAGIDPEILPRLFTKFASKSEKGTGLGLFISKKIIEAHGGKISAGNNKDGKGATFSFTVPLK